MANLTEAELDEMIRQARADEIERCAQLCTMRGDISRKSAAKLRKDGSYTTWAVWPPFKTATFVAPKWEQAAKDCESVAHAFDMLARGIRAGWDPRDLERERDQHLQIKFPCTRCTDPMDCGSWASCPHFGAWPSAKADDKR